MPARHRKPVVQAENTRNSPVKGLIRCVLYMVGVELDENVPFTCTKCKRCREEHQESQGECEGLERMPLLLQVSYTQLPEQRGE